MVDIFLLQKIDTKFTGCSIKYKMFELMPGGRWGTTMATLNLYSTIRVNFMQYECNWKILCIIWFLKSLFPSCELVVLKNASLFSSYTQMKLLNKFLKISPNVVDV